MTETQIEITTRSGKVLVFWQKDIKPATKFLEIFGLRGKTTDGEDKFIQQYAVDDITIIQVERPAK